MVSVAVLPLPGACVCLTCGHAQLEASLQGHSFSASPSSPLTNAVHHYQIVCLHCEQVTAVNVNVRPGAKADAKKVYTAYAVARRDIDNPVVTGMRAPKVGGLVNRLEDSEW